MDEFAIEIKYNCNDYGGAIIDYSLEIHVPNCGQADVNWKKICGNPILTRDGLSVLMLKDDKKINLI